MPEPGEVAEPEGVVDEPGVEGEGVAPGEGRDDGDDAVGHEDRRADEAPSDEGALHDRGEGEPDDEFHRHGDDGDDDGGEDVAPPQVVGEDDAVVAQAHEVAPGRIGDPVAVER